VHGIKVVSQCCCCAGSNDNSNGSLDVEMIGRAVNYCQLVEKALKIGK